jgi:hypothetical protein
MSDRHEEAARHLADLLAQENAALKRLDFLSAVALVPAKEAALAELEKAPKGSTTRTGLWQRLSELAKENQALLERAIEVQTRIVRIVARAGAPIAATTRYNDYGGRQPHTRAAAMAVSTKA